MDSEKNNFRTAKLFALIFAILASVATIIGVIAQLYLLKFGDSLERDALEAYKLKERAGLLMKDYNKRYDDARNIITYVQPYINNKNESDPIDININVQNQRTSEYIDKLKLLEINLDSLLTEVINMDARLDTLSVPPSDIDFFVDNSNSAKPQSTVKTFFKKLLFTVKRAFNKLFFPRDEVRQESLVAVADNHNVLKMEVANLITEFDNLPLNVPSSGPELDSSYHGDILRPIQPENSDSFKDNDCNGENKQTPKARAQKLLTPKQVLEYISYSSWVGTLKSLTSERQVEFRFTDGQCETNYFSKNRKAIEQFSYDIQPYYKTLNVCLRIGKSKKVPKDDYFILENIDLANPSKLRLVHMYSKEKLLSATEQAIIECDRVK